MLPNRTTELVVYYNDEPETCIAGYGTIQSLPAVRFLDDTSTIGDMKKIIRKNAHLYLPSEFEKQHVTATISNECILKIFDLPNTMIILCIVLFLLIIVFLAQCYNIYSKYKHCKRRRLQNETLEESCCIINEHENTL